MQRDVDISVMIFRRKVPAAIGKKRHRSTCLPLTPEPLKVADAGSTEIQQSLSSTA